MEKNKIELLSPAGSFESLMGAIQGGADAIYFGVEQLNMRTRSADYFTIEDIKKIAETCRNHNIKCFLTLNTVLFDHDISLMKKIVDEAKQYQVNAIIASDHAVMNYCRKKGVPVHISTQANVTNIDTVEFYSSYADVIVLARELSLIQVEVIHREIIRRNIKGPSGNLIHLEVFGHGALCMAVSGKCYMSLHTSMASANRGACMQNCRKSYIVTDKEGGTEFEIENEYIMSAKDLCTIDFLDNIINAGVSVLKIEGRGRSADYVFTTTQCYREAIDAFYNGEYSQDRFDSWRERLSSVYNRGFWDGYYLGRKMGEWSNQYGSKASKQKIFIGRGINYYPKVKAGEFQLESHSLVVGDEILITGPTTGVLQTFVKELRMNNFVTEKVKKGDVFTLFLEEKIRPSDKLYKLLPSKMIRIEQQRVKCIGCNACVEAAPDRWRMSRKDGKCTLVGATEKRGFFSTTLDEDELENNLLAAANCPVKCIKIKRI